MRSLHSRPPVPLPFDVESGLPPSSWRCKHLLPSSCPIGVTVSRVPISLSTVLSSSISVASSSGIYGNEAVDGGDGPVYVEFEPIAGEEEFDRVMEEARLDDRLAVVLWKAIWCRKCIYLKPMLEKLAATYHPRIMFYSIDVNSVPQRLVSRAGVHKMPTIQLWKECKKQEEVIGGHKTWIVVNDVQQMIDNHY